MATRTTWWDCRSSTAPSRRFGEHVLQYAVRRIFSLPCSTFLRWRPWKCQSGIIPCECIASAAEAKFWEAPDFSRTGMPPALAEIARNASKRFLEVYQTELRTFEQEQQVAPGIVVTRTGGPTPGHAVVRIVSGNDRLMFGATEPALSRPRG